MAPSTPAPPDPGSLESILRPTESIKATAPCRLRASAGRIQAEVAVIQTEKNESGVLVYVPATDLSPVKVLHALPITTGFSSALQQTPPSPSTSFFAQSSKPYIELVLTKGGSTDKKIELQFAPSESARVQAIIRAIRKAVDISNPSPFSHAWLAFYPEVEDIASSPTDAESMAARMEASFGKLGASDSEDSSREEDGAKDGTTAEDDGDDSKDLESIRFSSEPPIPVVDKGKGKEKDEDDGDDNVEDKKHEVDDSKKFPNPYAPGFDRTRFLRSRLFARQEKWSTPKPVGVRVVTYNVNDRVPPANTKELGPLLGYGAEDIIAVGLQEADLRSSSLFVSQGADRADSWEKAIFNGLGDNQDQYEKIATVQYVGVLLIIVVRKELRPHITMIQESARGIGLLGVGGNKAGVAVRLKVHDTVLTFINSHLAAFANQLERRRYDYLALRAGLTFPVPEISNPALEAYYPEYNKPYTMDHSDVVFWCGDLNYRLELQDSEVWALVDSKEWDKLLLGDQLLGDISQNMSFAGFSEPTINFPPTFKFVHGSVTLDPKRAPAYTDRVLHLSRGPKITTKKYTSHELLWSDHLPVSSTYSVDTRFVDETKRSEELVAVQCELDKLDEMYRASLVVDKDEVEFGPVTYRRPVKREIILRNTGRVPATFSFRVPSPGKPICKPWFWPFPSTGVVESGQELCITVTAEVDETQTLGLTGGNDMNDVLVLQIAGGKEAFVSLRAQFQPTIVGLSLELCSSLPDAIRKVPLAERKALIFPNEDDPSEASKENGHAKSLKPPREVWRLLEKLIAEGTGVEKLWTDEPNMPAVLDVIEALDIGEEEIPGTPKDAAQALLHILYALPSPLVPESERAECQAATERFGAFGIIEKLPSLHANVLIGLMSVAKLLAGDDKPVDDATVKVLATAVFAGPPAGREGFFRALTES